MVVGENSMKFYLVVAWDVYYPDSGLGNIRLVTYNYEFAELKAKEIRESKNAPDHVIIYDSEDLPWEVMDSNEPKTTS